MIFVTVCGGEAFARLSNVPKWINPSTASPVLSGIRCHSTVVMNSRSGRLCKIRSKEKPSCTY